MLVHLCRRDLNLELNADVIPVIFFLPTVWNVALWLHDTHTI